MFGAQIGHTAPLSIRRLLLVLTTIGVHVHTVLSTPSIRATIVNGGGSSDGPATSNESGGNGVAANVERYYFEHMIGKKEAAAAFEMMADDLINKPTPAWCPACTKTIVRYCLDQRMLHDHCCCDSGHARDQLPWLPHSCYVGDNCKPNMKSCMQYTEIRECCCDRLMAKQWRDIQSAASRRRWPAGSATLIAAATVFVSYLT